MASDADKRHAVLDRADEVAAALDRVKAAAVAGRPVDLADAKVLEAAGCWLRRNAVAS